MASKSQSSTTSPTSSLQLAISELSQAITGEVRFDDGSRAVYATDASNYREIPVGVVIPKNNEDVQTTLAVCRKYSLPILSRGGGTSVAGQCCNEAVVLDFSKYMNRVLEISAEEMFARVEPGVVLDDLQGEARKVGLRFGPDPSTHSRCTIGGMMGNDACGIHSLFTGRTSHNIESMKVMTYDGMMLEVTRNGEMKPLSKITQETQYRLDQMEKGLQEIRSTYAKDIRDKFPKIPRRVSGYSIDQLLDENNFHIARALVGTEGTCVVILEATIRLTRFPSQQQLLVLGFSNIGDAADCVRDILPLKPIGLEAFDDQMMKNMKRKGFHQDKIEELPKGHAWLLVELGADSDKELSEKTNLLEHQLRKNHRFRSIKVCKTPEEAKRFWTLREFGPGATVFVPGKPNTWSGWEDAAVAPERLGDYLRDFIKLLEQQGYEGSIYGHFGDGCIHTRISFDLESSKGIQDYRAFILNAAELVHFYGGSFSGEHGDGQARGELLEMLYGSKLVNAFREFKAIWDPDGKMNPGKLIDAKPMDQNLRTTATHQENSKKMFFAYSEDDGDFQKAVSRCVGIGKCRKKDAGTMCPSYMVTLEEKHSTRGRARMLAEMFESDVLMDQWKSREIKSALDLCLSCKACKTECPTNVDMATYKAEFMSHYYEAHKRPRASMLFANLHKWLKIGSLAPKLSNQMLRSKPVQSMLVRYFGLSKERELPLIADETYLHWLRKRGRRNRGAPEVILWPDTFNNYFHPEVLQSATKVLEAVGFYVRVPRSQFCCGRPLYDFGMLKTAKKRLKMIVRSFLSSIRRGVPVVVLEPSCASVFRDEMVGLFAEDTMVKKFSQQIFTLSEFLERNARSVKYPTINKKVVMQGHCHQQAVLGMEDERKLLSKLGVDLEAPDSGCCGMAGAFGFHDETYDLSMKLGERVIFKSVRSASDHDLILANGFSCREHIRQGTGRQAMHLAQILELSIRGF